MRTDLPGLIEDMSSYGVRNCAELVAWMILNVNDSFFFHNTPLLLTCPCNLRWVLFEVMKLQLSKVWRILSCTPRCLLRKWTRIKFLEYIETSKGLASPIDTDLRDAKRRINAVKPKKKNVKEVKDECESDESWVDISGEWSLLTTTTKHFEPIYNRFASPPFIRSNSRHLWYDSFPHASQPDFQTRIKHITLIMIQKILVLVCC